MVSLTNVAWRGDVTSIEATHICWIWYGTLCICTFELEWWSLVGWCGMRMGWSWQSVRMAKRTYGSISRFVKGDTLLKSYQLIFGPSSRLSKPYILTDHKLEITFLPPHHVHLSYLSRVQQRLSLEQLHFKKCIRILKVVKSAQMTLLYTYNPKHKLPVSLLDHYKHV